MESITSQADKCPDEESTELSIKSKPTLTVKKLGEMIISSMDEQHEQEKDKDDNRLFQFKRILINFLFNGIATKSEDINASKLVDWSPLIEDDYLVLYTFFISNNEQFNFEWSYLLSKIDKIEEFLLKFRRYINFICSDIDELIKHIPFEDNAVFVIDDYLKISYYNNDKSVKAEIKHNELHRILNCKEEYYSLKVIYKFKTAILLNRTLKIDTKKASEKIKTLMNIIIEDNQHGIEDIKAKDENN